ncbi:hypothetical protein OE88DRAFT_1085649 [Heliocybe sulcata]|uniref:Uncharacterized protein n=1 Tax=Heliocybe sulcata TaxID=5364 RepID=A0A5C3MLT6_9AGAM|nr:hypothetical protein OE88DRAFT_1085649 [Heliocybe sulcata]
MAVWNAIVQQVDIIDVPRLPRIAIRAEADSYFSTLGDSSARWWFIYHVAPCCIPLSHGV